MANHPIMKAIEIIQASSDSTTKAIENFKGLMAELIEEMKAQVDDIRDLKNKDENNSLLILNFNEQLENVKRESENREKINISLINRLNEQIKSLERENVEIKKNIVLSKDQINRDGRPSLTREDIEYIQEMRRQGYSQRKVAEMAGVSNGAVAKYDIGHYDLESMTNRSDVFRKNNKT